MHEPRFRLDTPVLYRTQLGNGHRHKQHRGIVTKITRVSPNLFLYQVRNARYGYTVERYET